MMEDEKIIELFFGRSEQGIRELDIKYGKICRKLSNNIVNNRQDAEECVSDAYLGAWNAIPPACPDPLLPYLCKIVRNISLKSYYKKEAAKRNSNYTIAMEEIEACIAAPDTVETEVDARELARIMESFLDTLTTQNRIIFLRRYWFSDSCKDIAEFVGLTEKNITVRLTRIRQKMKSYLAEREVFAFSLFFSLDEDDLSLSATYEGALELIKGAPELIAKVPEKITIVPPVSPMELTMTDSKEAVLFDPSVPADKQLQLTGLHRRTIDGYGKLIGASAEEKAMVLSAYVPRRKGETDGGVDIPLLYIIMYAVSDIENLQDYAFIGGQLMTFEQMEQYKVYEDERYVCYDASDLFYTDLRQYVESIVSQRDDVYFDEQIWERVQNIHRYYRENIGKLLGYR